MPPRCQITRTPPSCMGRNVRRRSARRRWLWQGTVSSCTGCREFALGCGEGCPSGVCRVGCPPDLPFGGHLQIPLIYGLWALSPPPSPADHPAWGSHSNRRESCGECQVPWFLTKLMSMSQRRDPRTQNTSPTWGSPQEVEREQQVSTENRPARPKSHFTHPSYSLNAHTPTEVREALWDGLLRARGANAHGRRDKSSANGRPVMKANGKISRRRLSP